MAMTQGDTLGWDDTAPSVLTYLESRKDRKLLRISRCVGLTIPTPPPIIQIVPADVSSPSASLTLVRSCRSGRADSRKDSRGFTGSMSCFLEGMRAHTRKTEGVSDSHEAHPCPSSSVYIRPRDECSRPNASGSCRPRRFGSYCRDADPGQSGCDPVPG